MKVVKIPKKFSLGFNALVINKGRLAQNFATAVGTANRQQQLHLETPKNLPTIIFSRKMVTQSSLSGLVCSCQNPTACPSSWTTIPNLSQFLPIEMAWGPLPRLPTKEQQLQKKIQYNFYQCCYLSCQIAKTANHLKTN